MRERNLLGAIMALGQGSNLQEMLDAIAGACKVPVVLNAEELPPLAKEGLLKDQLNIRYLGFESAEKQPWSCAKEGRKGTWQELEPMLVAVLEAEEKGPGLTGRLRYY